MISGKRFTVRELANEVHFNHRSILVDESNCVRGVFSCVKLQTMLKIYISIMITYLQIPSSCHPCASTR
ncbi:MAG: hypothetical protein VR65_24185 [Desulfobulbaceae bacterium BRH_c16a]|nr:MAG: hypothetical protein VR65_24185 [Desulfobulbaceae bacterium BRH_c16a]